MSIPSLPIAKCFRHFVAVVGDDLPADYISPPDDPRGNPTLDATLFVPFIEGRTAKDADTVQVHRNFKGDKWRVVDRTFVETS